MLKIEVNPVILKTSLISGFKWWISRDAPRLLILFCASKNTRKPELLM